MVARHLLKNIGESIMGKKIKKIIGFISGLCSAIAMLIIGIKKDHQTDKFLKQFNVKEEKFKVAERCPHDGGGGGKGGNKRT
jgi:hypothetical protein